MSDILKHTPESAARFVIRHPRATSVVALSTALAFAVPLVEAPKLPTHVKIGSYDDAIMDQLRENEGATLRGGPSTNSAPIGIAPIGEKFEVSGTSANGSWIRVTLDPTENIPDVKMNWDLIPNRQAPTDVYIRRSLVKRAPDKQIR